MIFDKLKMNLDLEETNMICMPRHRIISFKDRKIDNKQILMESQRLCIFMKLGNIDWKIDL